MTTRRETVLAKVQTVLAGMAGVTVDRNVDTEIDPADMPAAVQFDGGHVVVPRESGETAYTANFSVQGSVTGANRAAVTAAVDTLYGQIVTALVADPTLGGLVSDVRETAMSDPEFLTDAEAPFAEFAVDFEVDFETAEHDPNNTP